MLEKGSNSKVEIIQEEQEPGERASGEGGRREGGRKRRMRERGSEGRAGVNPTPVMAAENVTKKGANINPNFPKPSVKVHTV